MREFVKLFDSQDNLVATVYKKNLGNEIEFIDDKGNHYGKVTSDAELAQVFIKIAQLAKNFYGKDCFPRLGRIE